MLLGYARVSTPDQSIDLQLDALRSAGVERVWTDVASGSRGDRPGLEGLLQAAQSGDQVVVWRLDRLGRSLAHLAQLAKDLAERGVTIRSLTDGVDTSGSTGRLLLGLLGTLAEYEREILIERTVAGLQAARRRGTTLGRRPSLTTAQVEEIRKMHEGGRGLRELGRLFRVDPATINRALKSSRYR